MRQRTITAVFFVLAMLCGVYGGAIPFFLLFLLISVGCLWEFYALTLPADEPGATIRLWFAISVAILPYIFISLRTLGIQSVLADTDPEWLFLWPAFGLTFGAAILELFLGARQPFVLLGHILYGAFYVTLPFVLIVLIYRHVGVAAPDRVFGLLILTWTNDTFAYLFGRKFGKHKLFERVSPNKTWEGTISGTVCTVLLSVLLAYLFPSSFTMSEWIALGVVAGIFATVGDLVESLLKRSVGAKDSGSLLPGHGGLLDRFDAFLLVVPISWLVLTFLLPQF